MGQTVTPRGKLRVILRNDGSDQATDRRANSRGRKYPEAPYGGLNVWPSMRAYIKASSIIHLLENFMEIKQLMAAIGKIGKASAKLTRDVQAVAVECAVHAVEHGNVTPANELVESLGKGMRRASLRTWFEKHTPMFIPKGKDKFAFDSQRAKEMKKDIPALRDKLAALPWEDAKPQEQVVSVFDVSEAVDKFMKRLETMAKDAAVTVRNRELLELLNQQVSIYHAERVLAGRIAE